MRFDQSEYQVRLEWGRMGVERLSPISDVTIIVDVLSFSTTVDVAIQRGAIVYPYKWKDQSAKEFAIKKQLLIAQFNRSKTEFSLSPTSLHALPSGAGIVLPSPNGSTLSLTARSEIIITACLRNASSVANFARENGTTIALIPAGEKWPDQTLRPAFEDLLGVGAILKYLEDLKMSPECKTALALFNDCQNTLFQNLRDCLSGRELIERGFLEDVEFAAQLNVSQSVPILRDGMYVSLA